MSDETIYEKLKHSLVIMKLKDLGVMNVQQMQLIYHFQYLAVIVL